MGNYGSKKKLSTLEDLYINELCNLYLEENLIFTELPKIFDDINSPKLLELVKKYVDGKKKNLLTLINLSREIKPEEILIITDEIIDQLSQSNEISKIIEILNLKEEEINYYLQNVRPTELESKLLEDFKTTAVKIEPSFAFSELVHEETSLAVQGLLKEINEMRKEELDPDVKDAGFIAGIQRLVHYILAGFGTARVYARKLSLVESSKHLNLLFNSEKAMDIELNKFALWQSRAAGGRKA